MREIAGSERREAPRYAITADIPLAGNVSITCVNLSSRGIYFHTGQAFVEGQEMSLTLPFNSAGPSETRVTCNARVVRVEQFRDGYGVAATYEPVAFEVAVADPTASLHP
jgi:hypothetical protein